MSRQPRAKDADHLAWIRTLRCAVCDDPTSVEAAHVRYGVINDDPRISKRHTGIGEKPDDRWVVPLCSRHHREQHDCGEKLWWYGLCINPIELADRLYRNSGDNELVPHIMKLARARI